MVPSATAYWPVNADVVHPIKQELSVSRGMELNVVDVLSHTVLDMRLADVPFLQQDNFNGIFPSFGDRDVLISLNRLHKPSATLKQFNGLGPRFHDRHANQWSCNIGHFAFKVNGLERRQTEFSKDSHVVLIAERTHHEDAASKIGLDRWVLTDLNGCFSALRGQGERNVLANKMSITLVVGVNNDNTTGTNQFWPGCRNHHVRAVFTSPTNINQVGFPR